MVSSRDVYVRNDNIMMHHSGRNNIAYPIYTYMYAA